MPWLSHQGKHQPNMCENSFSSFVKLFNPENPSKLTKKLEELRLQTLILGKPYTIYADKKY